VAVSLTRQSPFTLRKISVYFAVIGPIDFQGQNTAGRISLFKNSVTSYVVRNQIYDLSVPITAPQPTALVRTSVCKTKGLVFSVYL
jgi:hypothetical protein